MKQREPRSKRWKAGGGAPAPGSGLLPGPSPCDCTAIPRTVRHDAQVGVTHICPSTLGPHRTGQLKATTLCSWEGREHREAPPRPVGGGWGAALPAPAFCLADTSVSFSHFKQMLMDYGCPWLFISKGQNAILRFNRENRLVFAGGQGGTGWRGTNIQM